MHKITRVCQLLPLLAQAMAVIVSCIISVVVLTRKNRNVQQRELQQSRNRATVTILLFALLYGVCNLPLVLNLIMYTATIVTDDWKIMDNYYQFDKHLYYQNATITILPAANSAANPILYFWRMPALREYIMSGIRRMLGLNREVRMPALREYIMSGMRRMLGLNREVRRPAVQQAETQPCNRVVENINIAQQLPASRHLETV